MFTHTLPGGPCSAICVAEACPGAIGLVEANHVREAVVGAVVRGPRRRDVGARSRVVPVGDRVDVVPRYEDDPLRLPGAPQDVGQDELKAIAEELR